VGNYYAGLLVCHSLGLIEDGRRISNYQRMAERSSELTIRNRTCQLTLLLTLE
jgi:hypothetical protein